MQNTVIISEDTAILIQTRIIEIAKSDWIYGLKAAIRSKDKAYEDIPHIDIIKIDRLLDVHRAFIDGTMQRLLGIELNPHKVFEAWTKEAKHEFSKKS